MATGSDCGRREGRSAAASQCSVRHPYLRSVAARHNIATVCISSDPRPDVQAGSEPEVHVESVTDSAAIIML